MGTVIFILIAIGVLSSIKAPKRNVSTSGKLTEARRRKLRKAARQARERGDEDLPWLS